MRRPRFARTPDRRQDLTQHGTPDEQCRGVATQLRAYGATVPPNPTFKERLHEELLRAYPGSAATGVRRPRRAWVSWAPALVIPLLALGALISSGLPARLPAGQSGAAPAGVLRTILHGGHLQGALTVPLGAVQTALRILNSGDCTQTYDLLAPMHRGPRTRAATIAGCEQSKKARARPLLVQHRALAGPGAFAHVAAPDYRGPAYDQLIIWSLTICRQVQRTRQYLQLIPLAGHWYVYGMGQKRPNGAVSSGWGLIATLCAPAHST